MLAGRSRAANKLSSLQTCSAGAIGVWGLLMAANCGATAGEPAVADNDAGGKSHVSTTTGGDSGSTTTTVSHDAGHELKGGDASKTPDAPAVVPDANHGAPSSTYPAFTTDVAQVVDNGGAVLSAPVIVTITWSTDPDATTFNTFGDSIGPSTYWGDINSEYGVGAAVSGAANHVSITTAPPPSFSDSDLDSFVSAHAGVDWPASTANTIYAVYLPPGVGIFLGGAADAGGQDACAAGVGGYHDETQDNNHYVYAIMPHCSDFQVQDIELGASHEFNEAATDPHPETALAYEGFDQNHLSFEFFNQFQDELGDACESFVEASDAVDFTPYVVQRQWSNKSAAAGSHWCLPALDEPFYNTTFIPSSNLDMITVNLGPLGIGAGAVQTEGFKVAIGSSRRVPIGFISDVDTNGPFTLDIQGLDQPISQDQNGNPINNGTATVTLDTTSGVNGDIAYLTITPTAYSTLGTLFFYVRAVLPSAQQHHYLPILVSQN